MKIQELATGALGWLPSQFWEQELEDTIIAINGYIDKQIDEERILRRLGVMIVSPWADKNFNVFKYWPIAKDEEVQQGIQKNMRQAALAHVRQMKHNEAVKKHGNSN